MPYLSDYPQISSRRYSQGMAGWWMTGVTCLDLLTLHVDLLIAAFAASGLQQKHPVLQHLADISSGSSKGYTDLEKN